MKIAQIAPIEESVPPKKYGGIEVIIDILCKKLVARGHDVTLFATGDSETPAKLFPLVPEAVRTSHVLENFTDKKMYFEMMKHNALGKALMEIKKGNFDIVHSHVTWRLFPYTKLINTPFVFTLHIPLNDDFKKVAYSSFPDYNYVSISNFQRTPLPNLNYLDTIYNGTEIDRYLFNSTGGRDLFFLGRSTITKAPHLAISIAQKAGMSLTLAMKIEKINEADYKYYRTEVEPQIDGSQIKEIQEIAFEDKIALLSQSLCLVFTSQWEEPFGLVMTEAMACGTPVVAFAHGSVPEVVKDGETGFIINFSNEDKRGDWIIKTAGVEGMVEAVNRIRGMPEQVYKKMRLDCRRHVEWKFTVEHMVEGYERVYGKILASRD